MKRKVLASLLGLWVLAFTSPSWAFECAMPCKMTQKQMLDCARVCSAKKPVTSVGKGDCVKMQVAAAKVFTATAKQVVQAPVVLEFVAIISPNFCLGGGLATGQPLRGPPNSFRLELNTANAPPQLI